MANFLDRVQIRPLFARNRDAKRLLGTQPPQRTFAEMRDDMRLRTALQRAIRRDAAPQHLINTIREQIRG